LDNSGTLTIEELKAAFGSGGNEKTKEYWEKFIRNIDKDGDKEISLEEFCNGMAKMLD